MSDVAPLALLVLGSLPPPGQHVVVGHYSTITMRAENAQYNSWNNAVIGHLMPPATACGTAIVTLATVRTRHAGRITRTFMPR